MNGKWTICLSDGRAIPVSERDAKRVLESICMGIGYTSVDLGQGSMFIMSPHVVSINRPEGGA